MDTSDSGISFDKDGCCDYCNNFNSIVKPSWHTDEKGKAELHLLADQIRLEGKGKDFDCIIGLSGGLDSSYATYVAKEKMGLRPLLFHVDAGWNTFQSVGNIDRKLPASLPCAYLVSRKNLAGNARIPETFASTQI